MHISEVIGGNFGFMDLEVEDPLNLDVIFNYMSKKI